MQPQTFPADVHALEQRGRPPLPPSGGGPRPSRLTLDRVVRLLLGVAALAVVGWLLWFFAALVVYLLVGVLIAYLLRPLVDRLQSVGLGRVPAVLVTLTSVLLAIGWVITSLLPVVAHQISELVNLVADERLADVAASLEEALQPFVPLQQGAIFEGLTRTFETLFQDQELSATFTSMVSLVSNIFYAVLVIPFVAFFFLKDGTRIRLAIFRLVPNRYFEIALAILAKIETNLGRYFKALLVQCVTIGTVASLLLTVVGLDYAVAVGIFTGLANTIPYFGPLMGFLAGTLVGIAQTGNFALVPGVLVAMVLTQAVDNLLVYPLIFSRAARTHPLIILFVVLIAAQLAGIVGMLVAIPLTTIVRVAVEQVLWSLRNYRIMKAT